MDQHGMTDREQADQVRQWLKSYTLPIILAVALGVGGSYLYRGWQSRKVQSNTNASDLYADMLTFAYTKDYNNLNQAASQLVRSYPDSVYSSMGKLVQAQQQAAQKQYQAAIKSLHWVLTNTKAVPVRDMAEFSLAGVYAQQQKPYKSLKELDKISSSYAPMVWQQKAMVYQQMNDSAKAVSALIKAKQLYQKDNIPNPLLDILLAQYPVSKA